MTERPVQPQMCQACAELHGHCKSKFGSGATLAHDLPRKALVICAAEACNRSCFTGTIEGDGVDAVFACLAGLSGHSPCIESRGVIVLSARIRKAQPSDPPRFTASS
jgi:hypothetical protein